MKQCPQCRQTFSDDNRFCLSDGTPLDFFDDAPEEITVIRSVPNLIQPPFQQPQTIVKQGVNPIFTCLSVGIILILFAGVIGLLGYIFFSKTSNNNSNLVSTNITNVNPPQNNSVNQIANLQRQQAEIEREKQRLANERKKIDEEKNKPLPTPTISTTPPIIYPPQPTARIKFGRGKVAETVSGTVYTERNFVLEARNGQYLSGVVGGGNCVRFSNGSNSIGFVTSAGDNRLTVVNSCSSASNFSLTVSIK